MSKKREIEVTKLFYQLMRGQFNLSETMEAKLVFKTSRGSGSPYSAYAGAPVSPATVAFSPQPGVVYPCMVVPGKHGSRWYALPLVPVIEGTEWMEVKTILHATFKKGDSGLIGESTEYPAKKVLAKGDISITTGKELKVFVEELLSVFIVFSLVTEEREVENGGSPEPEDTPEAEETEPPPLPVEDTPPAEETEPSPPPVKDAPADPQFNPPTKPANAKKKTK